MAWALEGGLCRRGARSRRSRQLADSVMVPDHGCRPQPVRAFPSCVSDQVGVLDRRTVERIAVIRDRSVATSNHQSVDEATIDEASTPGDKNMLHVYRSNWLLPRRVQRKPRPGIQDPA